VRRDDLVFGQGPVSDAGDHAVSDLPFYLTGIDAPGVAAALAVRCGAAVIPVLLGFA
jgi:hypothetical protein